MLIHDPQSLRSLFSHRLSVRTHERPKTSILSENYCCPGLWAGWGDHWWHTCLVNFNIVIMIVTRRLETAFLIRAFSVPFTLPRLRQGFLEYWIGQRIWISAELNGKDLAKNFTNNICSDCGKKDSGQNFITLCSITPDLWQSKVTSMYLVLPASSSSTI